jgi:MATE family multidrug resistance protein
MSSALDRFLDSPFRSFSRLWVPVLFSLIAEPLTGLVDTAFVARLGASELAALGVGTAVLTGGLWLFNFLSVGSQTEVSQAYGRGDLKKGKRIGSLALIVGSAVGAAAALFVFVFAPPLSVLMGAVAEVHEFSVVYIRVRAFGGPAVLLSMVSCGILYGLADMRTPLLVALTVNGLNIVLDVILIFGFGPIPALGVGGAALASTIGQWVGALLCCLAIYKKIGFTLQVDAADIRKLLGIGRDMFIRTGMLIFFLLLATRSATRLGPEAGAAHQAIRQVWMFTTLFLDASAITAQSLVGYYFGSGDFNRALLVARLVCRWSLLVGIVLLGLMLLSTRSAGALLVPASGLSLFVSAWGVAALLQPLAALAFVTDGIHWGTGDFTYLRNAVTTATIFSAIVLLGIEAAGWSSLTMIWFITGLWVLIRAGFGIYRLWPGMAGSPLLQMHEIPES